MVGLRVIIRFSFVAQHFECVYQTTRHQNQTKQLTHPLFNDPQRFIMPSLSVPVMFRRFTLIRPRLVRGRGLATNHVLGRSIPTGVTLLSLLSDTSRALDALVIAVAARELEGHGEIGFTLLSAALPFLSLFLGLLGVISLVASLAVSAHGLVGAVLVFTLVEIDSHTLVAKLAEALIVTALGSALVQFLHEGLVAVGAALGSRFALVLAAFRAVLEIKELVVNRLIVAKVALGVRALATSEEIDTRLGADLGRINGRLGGRCLVFGVGIVGCLGILVLHAALKVRDGSRHDGLEKD